MLFYSNLCYNYIVVFMRDERDEEFIMKKIKKLTQEELDGIEYAVLSTAMETGATEEEINEGRGNLKKVHVGEWTDEDYRANIIKKYNLNIVSLKSLVVKDLIDR